MGIVSSRPQINSKLKFVTSFLHNPKLKENKTILAIWLVTAAITVIAKLIIGKFNNYKIFEGVYNHAIHGLTLYGPYPEEYGDVNLYGIIFSFIISPFAILPQWLGMVLWVMANTALLFYAIQQLPLSKNQKAIICWTAYIELITAQLVQQFNISVGNRINYFAMQNISIPVNTVYRIFAKKIYNSTPLLTAFSADEFNQAACIE